MMEAVVAGVALGHPGAPWGAVGSRVCCDAAG